MKCKKCQRGQEACQYCEDLTPEDLEAVCDCGLYDFGSHFFDCQTRENFKYVVIADPVGLKEPR